MLLMSVLSGCTQKEIDSLPGPGDRIVAPKADFTYTPGENGEVHLRFTLNRNDYYSIDPGNGRILKDSVTGSHVSHNFAATRTIRYTTNGSYTITLTVANTKGVASSTQAVNITSVPPPPVAGFSYRITERGTVSFTNEGQHFQTVQWSHFQKNSLYGYVSAIEHPVFIFENDGMHYIRQTVINKYGDTRTHIDSVYINTTKNTGNPVFEGVFFDQTGQLSGLGVNTMRESWGAAALSNFTVNNTLLKDRGNILITLGLPEDLSPEGKYNFYKKTLTPGTIGQVFVTRNKPLWSTGEETLLVHNTPGALTEIVSVEEVEQPRLFPELYHKAFWVTFRIKADFKEKGKIDGTLKVRYLIY